MPHCACSQRLQQTQWLLHHGFRNLQCSSLSSLSRSRWSTAPAGNPPFSPEAHHWVAGAAVCAAWAYQSLRSFSETDTAAVLHKGCEKLTGSAACAPCWSGRQSACDPLTCAEDVAKQISKVAAHLADLHGEDVHPEHAEHAALDQQIRADQARVARERRLNEARHDAVAREAAAQHLQVRASHAPPTFGRCICHVTAVPRSAATINISSYRRCRCCCRCQRLRM